jgi:Protein of unknown function (DUF3040)
MTLPTSQQRALDRIEKALADDHPGLDRLFGMFTRLSGHEPMPEIERVSAQQWRRRRTRRWRGQTRPAIATVVGLSMAIGVLLGISLLLPSTQECRSGKVSPVAARVHSVPAEPQPACPTGPAKQGNPNQVWP